MCEVKRRKQLLGSRYNKPSFESSRTFKSRILNDAPQYSLKTPPWLNKWGFTDNANLDNPPIDIAAIEASMNYIDQKFYPIKTFNTSQSSYRIKHLGNCSPQ